MLRSALKSRALPIYANIAPLVGLIFSVVVLRNGAPHSAAARSYFPLTEITLLGVVGALSAVYVGIGTASRGYDGAYRLAARDGWLWPTGLYHALLFFGPLLFGQWNRVPWSFAAYPLGWSLLLRAAWVIMLYNRPTAWISRLLIQPIRIAATWALVARVAPLGNPLFAFRLARLPRLLYRLNSLQRAVSKTAQEEPDIVFSVTGPVPRPPGIGLRLTIGGAESLPEAIQRALVACNLALANAIRPRFKILSGTREWAALQSYCLQLVISGDLVRYVGARGIVVLDPITNRVIEGEW